MRSFTWDGTEVGLMDLMIWWASHSSYAHTEDCVGQDIYLHCCFGKVNSNAEIGMELRTTKHGDSLPIYFKFTNSEKRYPMHAGDTIFYDGNGKYSFLESFECVAISQDWP